MRRVAVDDGDHERALAHAVQAREHARELGPAMGQAPLHLHAQAVRQAGDFDEAASLFEQSLELNRKIGDEGMVDVELHNPGHVELRRGKVDDAERYFAQCTSPAEDDRYGVALATFNDAAMDSPVATESVRACSSHTAKQCSRPRASSWPPTIEPRSTGCERSSPDRPRAEDLRPSARAASRYSGSGLPT